MVNVWQDTLPGLDLFHSIPIPYNNTPESSNYFTSVLEELVQKLNDIGGHFSLSALERSLNLYQRIRSIQYSLYKQRYKGSCRFSAAELMTIMDAGTLIPTEEYLALLEKLSVQLPDNNEKPRPGISVLVSGSLVERPEVMEMIESCGGRIVADELCNGLRQILPIDGKGETPMDRLIHRTMNRFPCPSRTRAADRSLRLRDLLKQSHAKGVIFLLQKFCTPHLSDIPMLSDSLKKAGFPSLVIEMAETWQMEGQVKTRLEGFFEMVGERSKQSEPRP